MVSINVASVVRGAADIVASIHTLRIIDRMIATALFRHSDANAAGRGFVVGDAYVDTGCVFGGKLTLAPLGALLSEGCQS